MSNILFVIPSLSSAGGAEKLIDSLSRILGSDHKIYQASFDSFNTKRYFENEVQFYPLGSLIRIPLPLRWITYFIRAYRLTQLKQKLDIDISISVLWSADIINVLSLSKDKKISLAVINILNNPTNRLMVTLRVIVGMIYRSFDRILAISNPLLEELYGLYHIKKEKSGVFRNFVSLPKPAPVWGDDKVHRFVFCGRLVYEKNVDGLLALWADFSSRHPNCQLVIIGDGPLSAELHALALRLGLSIGFDCGDNVVSVLFLGSCLNPENYMNGARAFMLTSRDEGVPTVLLLAFALHLPVLVSDCHSGGVRDLLGLPDTPVSAAGIVVSSGMLLPIPESSVPESIAEWSKALDVMEHDSEQHARWIRGSEDLAETFSVEAAERFWKSEMEHILN